MKSLLLATLGLLLLAPSGWAQGLQGLADPHTGAIRCATVEVDEHLRNAHPELGTHEEFEAWLSERMRRRDFSATREVLTIPVVVHVIHNGETLGAGTNITYDQVASQIEVLNEDFRRLEGTNGFNEDSVGADIEIEFCLATLGPDGRLLAEVGIHRVNRNEQGWQAPPYSTNYVNRNIKPATIWDPRQYFNIWVTPLSNSVLGFAQTPIQSGLPDLFGTSTETTDGVVINTQNFGREGNVTAPFNGGRTTTHEVGHWLGLYHPWGPSNNSTDCDIDDYCDDTPTTEEPFYGCQRGVQGCTSRAMVENYMDYSNDACMNIFTQCQKARMRTVMENSPRRKELLTSTVCAQITAAPIADFSFSDTITCDGRVQFFDESANIAVDWLWLFGNGEESLDKNPQVRYDSTGTYVVTLFATNPRGIDQVTKSIHVIVNAPPVDVGEDINACVDDVVTLDSGIDDPTATYLWFPVAGLSDPFSPSTSLTVRGTTSYSLTVSFENGCEVRDTLIVNGSPKPTTLALPIGSITIPKGSGTQLNAIGAEMYVWSPVTGLSDPTIPNPFASPDTTTRYYVTGSNLAGCEKMDSVLVIVEETVGFGNVDHISQVQAPYPNPASEVVTFSATMKQAGRLTIELLDLQGRPVMQVMNERVRAGAWQHQWQRPQRVSAGSYLLRWRFEEGEYMQKLNLY